MATAPASTKDPPLAQLEPVAARSSPRPVATFNRLPRELPERIRPQAAGLIAELEHLIAQAVAHSREHLEDAPALRDWIWTG